MYNNNLDIEERMTAVMRSAVRSRYAPPFFTAFSEAVFLFLAKMYVE